MGSAEAEPGPSRVTTRPPDADGATIDRAGSDTESDVGSDANSQAEAVVPGGGTTLVLATFPDQASESRAYSGLMKARAFRNVRLRHVIVVKSDEASGITVETPLDRTPWVGVKYGLIGGAAAAMFMPPPILVTMLAFGGLGGALGKANQWLQRARLRRTLRGLLLSNEAGIIAVVPTDDLDATLAAMPGAIDVETAGLDDGSTRPRP
jgi:hypothetical protein